MSRLLQIAQLGHSVLRERAAPVSDVQDASIQELIDDMMATVSEAQGVGLAAPQVYQSKRIIIIASQPNARYPDAPQMQPTAMLNPKILSLSDKIEKDWEGCLSVPGIRGLVPRHHSLKLKYLTRQGKTATEEFSGFVARIVQHEIDHLEGIFFLDRMESNKEIITEKEYLRVLKEGQ